MGWSGNDRKRERGGISFLFLMNYYIQCNKEKE
jgi:hypothetical protein